MIQFGIPTLEAKNGRIGWGWKRCLPSFTPALGEYRYYEQIVADDILDDGNAVIHALDQYLAFPFFQVVHVGPRQEVGRPARYLVKGEAKSLRLPLLCGAELVELVPLESDHRCKFTSHVDSKSRA